MRILVINTGSTSSKAAIYVDGQETASLNQPHSRESLSKYASIQEQLPFRLKLVQTFLKERGITQDQLDCVVSRGGALPNVRSGATSIGPLMLEVLRDRPIQYHASNLSAPIAWQISGEGKIPAFVYDPISASERGEEALFVGIKGIRRQSLCHVLNSRAMAIAAAGKMGRRLSEMNIIVAHTGGGNSIALWAKGKLIDCASSDEGPFSAERCGGVRGEIVVDLCEERGCEEVRRLFLGKGGAVSVLGTNDLRDVERMIREGNKEALLLCNAMAFQTAKNIGALSAVVQGEVDALVFTGGGAYWERYINECRRRNAYLNAEIFVMPGENEMRSLAEGAARVLEGTETAMEYTEEEWDDLS